MIAGMSASGERLALLAPILLAIGLTLGSAPPADAFAPRITAAKSALPLVLVRSCGKRCKDARVEQRREARRTTRDKRSRFYQRRHRPGYYSGAQTLPPARPGLASGTEDLAVEEAVTLSAPKFVTAPTHGLAD